MKYWVSLLAFSALALSTPAGAEVYKCRTADGRLEFANKPCPSGASTLKTVPDEKVSEANRLQAEREVERMREYVGKREAAQRAEQNVERQAGPPPVANGGAAPGRRVEDCLRELEQQALPAIQRAQLESACRSMEPSQAGYVPVPVPVAVPAHGGRHESPGDSCRDSVERLNLPAAERNRRLNQCAASDVAPPQPQYIQQPQPKPPAAPAAPGMALNCLPGANNCPPH
ncbi:MAG: DUF4124 domain-containing protein [Bacteroidota bacterium]